MGRVGRVGRQSLTSVRHARHKCLQHTPYTAIRAYTRAYRTIHASNHIVMAYIVMAYTVMAHIVMALYAMPAYTHIYSHV